MSSLVLGIKGHGLVHGIHGFGHRQGGQNIGYPGGALVQVKNALSKVVASMDTKTRSLFKSSSEHGHGSTTTLTWAPVLFPGLGRGI